MSSVDVTLPSVLELHRPMWAVPFFRQLVTNLSPQISRFDPRTVHMAFVVGKWL
jgi:hypothetical protein